MTQVAVPLQALNATAHAAVTLPRLQANEFAYGVNGYHSDTAKDPANRQPLMFITRDQILERVAAPTRFSKADAPFVIPSNLPTREFAAQREHGHYQMGWADIDVGGHTFEGILQLLKQCLPRWAVHAHTTSSATHEQQKTRLLWFYTQAIGSGAQWSRYQKFVNDLLASVGIVPDRVNERPAQLCFLPNAPTEFYKHHIAPGEDFCPLEFCTFQGFPPLEVIQAIDIDSLEDDNPNFVELFDNLEIIDDHNEGWLVECINADSHTNGDLSALLVAPNAATNANKGGYRCLHHNCEHLNIGHAYNTFKLQPINDQTQAFLPPVELAPAITDIEVFKPKNTNSILTEMANYHGLDYDPDGVELDHLIELHQDQRGRTGWEPFAKEAREFMKNALGTYQAWNDAIKEHVQRSKQAVYEAREVEDKGLQDAIDGIKLEKALLGGTMRPARIPSNVLKILIRLPTMAGILAYDTLANRPVWRSRPPFSSPNDDEFTIYPRPHDESDEAALAVFFDRGEVDMSGTPDKHIARQVRNAALYNKFNPLQDWLVSLTWDGVPRIDDWLRTYGGVNTKPVAGEEHFSLEQINAFTSEEMEGITEDQVDMILDRHFGRLSFLALAARAMWSKDRPRDPLGAKVDTMLTLCSPQGYRKTTLLEVLGGNWYTKSITEINKDTPELLQNVLVAESAEFLAFGGSGKRTGDVMKNTLDERKLTYVPKYIRQSITRPCNHVWFGTLNPNPDGTFLSDPTGNRRVWPVTCTRLCDPESLADDRDQLFAEAVALFRAGEPWWMQTGTNIEILASRRQKGATEVDPWEGAIRDHLSRIPVHAGSSQSMRLFTMDGLMQILDILPKDRTKAHRSRASNVLAMLGVGKIKQRRVHGVRSYFYEVPEDILHLSAPQPLAGVTALS